MTIVYDFFADVDNPTALKNECKESNNYHVIAEKKSFRLAGLKRGTKRRKNETPERYRARRVFSDMVSEALRWANTFNGDPTIIDLLVKHKAESLNEKMGRPISSQRMWYEAKKATREAMKMWDPEKATRIRESASKAGSVTKWSLEDHLATQGMTPTDASRHLGLSRPTVYAMRKHFQNVNPATGEIDDE